MLVVLLGPAAQAAPLINGGFETGDFTGWSSADGVDAGTGDPLVSCFEVPGPPDDTGLPENGTEGTFAVIYTAGPDSEPLASDIEADLGLSAGALDTFLDGVTGGDHDPHEGSAIYQTIDVIAGSVLSFDARFVSDETFGVDPTDSSQRLDFAFFSVVGAGVEDIFLIGSTADTDTGPLGPFDGASAPYVGRYVFSMAGTYTIGFGALDDEDDFVESALVLNNVSVGAPEIDVGQGKLPLAVALLILLAVSESRQLKVRPQEELS